MCTYSFLIHCCLERDKRENLSRKNNCRSHGPTSLRREETENITSRINHQGLSVRLEVSTQLKFWDKVVYDEVFLSIPIKFQTIRDNLLVKVLLKISRKVARKSPSFIDKSRSTTIHDPAALEDQINLVGLLCFSVQT